MTKFQKSNIWDCSFVGFFVAVVVVYSVFSVGAVFMEIFALQNCLFFDFSKNLKKRRFVRQNLPPRNCQPNYFIWYYALDTFYLINKKNGLKIRHYMASHDWVEWTRFEESHLHIFNGVLLLVNISHMRKKVLYTLELLDI